MALATQKFFNRSVDLIRIDIAARLNPRPEHVAKMLRIERVTLRAIAQLRYQWFGKRLLRVTKPLGDERLPVLRGDRTDRVVHCGAIQRS